MPKQRNRIRLALTAVALSLTGSMGCSQDMWKPRPVYGPGAERWTILCLELSGPGCTQNAQQIADVLKRTKGINADEVRVISERGEARVYYGTYYRKVDIKTRARADSRELDADVALIRELADERGQRFFMRARRVLSPSEQAEEPKWDLANVNATYTLQVAVYYNDDQLHDRKKAAIEKVRQLRDQGFEAYYYHGDTCSMVTVGAFGPEAVLDKSGRVSYVGRGGQRYQVAHHYSPEVSELQNKPECMYNRTNDNVEYNRDHRGKAVPVRSMLVHVPDGSSGL